MLNKNILISENTSDLKRQVLAMEECACQGLQAAQSLSDTSFVVEDMGSIIPALVKMTPENKDLYDLANSAIVTSLGRPEPADPNHESKILPTVMGATITVAQEDYKDKILAFVKNINNIASEVSYKLQKAYLWLTTHQSAIVKHLKKVNDEYVDRIRDSSVVIKGWHYKGKEVKTVDDAVDAAQYFLDEQLPILLEYCKHSTFITVEALDVLDDVLDKKIDEHRLDRLYKAHTQANVERILGSSQLDILGGRSVMVSEQTTRAKNINEKILAVTSVQVNFDNHGLNGESHNTPSADEKQASRIIEIANAIMKAVDIAEPKNAIGVLRRSADDFEKSLNKLDKVIDEGKYENRSDDDDRNYQDLVDASRMLSGLRLQATNFSVSTYTSATDIVEKLLSLIKLKD